MLLVIALVLALLVYAGVAWEVIKRYRLTRNLGFVILGCGVLVWPFVGGLLETGIRAAEQVTSNGPGFPFSLVAGGHATKGDLFAMWTYSYQIIHGGLILLGLMVLGRTGRSRQIPAH